MVCFHGHEYFLVAMSTSKPHFTGVFQHANSAEIHRINFLGIDHCTRTGWFVTSKNGIAPSNIHLVGNDEAMRAPRMMSYSEPVNGWSLGDKEPNIAGIFEDFEEKNIAIICYNDTNQQFPVMVGIYYSTNMVMCINGEPS